MRWCASLAARLAARRCRRRPAGPPATTSSSAAARSTTARGGAPYVGDVAHPGRPHRRGRAAARRARPARDRRARARGRAGLHQHAELGDRKPDPGRPRPERHPPGRDARSDGRRLVDGAAQRRDAARSLIARQDDIRYPITWTTLGEYLEHLERRGIAPNVASFVGAATVRIHELGEGDVDPTPAQLARMRALVRQAMNEGAMGVGSSLIYAPGNFAETDELVALVTEAGRCGGMYISHMRSEGDRILAIGRRADRDLPPLRRAGRNLPSQARRARQLGALRRGDPADRGGARARASGSPPTCTPIPPARPGSTRRCRSGCRPAGREAWIARLRDPAIRARVAAEMRRPGQGWENLDLRRRAGGHDVHRFPQPGAAPLCRQDARRGRARARHQPRGDAMDLVVEDGSRVGTIYFLMSEDNVRRQVAAALDELRLGRRQRRHRGRVPQLATRIRAPTAISRGCSAATSATSG